MPRKARRAGLRKRLALPIGLGDLKFGKDIGGFADAGHWLAGELSRHDRVGDTCVLAEIDRSCAIADYRMQDV
jgi:hypothetical protein